MNSHAFLFYINSYISLVISSGTKKRKKGLFHSVVSTFDLPPATFCVFGVLLNSALMTKVQHYSNLSNSFLWKKL